MQIFKPLLAVALVSSAAIDARADTCVVDATRLHQRIDGFGAGAAYLYEGQNPLAQEHMDFLYGVDPGEIGLTIIRLRIRQEAAGVWDWEIQNGQKAHALGAQILATPWTPPAEMKSDNNRIGGKLLPSQYSNYVDYLNDFLDRMADNGAPVSVISLQNEPDFIPDDYEGCGWSAEDFRIFCRDFAGGINAPVMMPESFNFNPAVSNATLNDPEARGNVDYIGGHLYGASVRDYPLAHELGKPTWMTEFLLNDQSIESALATAKQISDCLTVGNMSAYIWWKLIGDANGLLNNAGQPQRRAYVMAQFSRFVRPGYERIDTSETAGPLAVSAFVERDTGRFAIVAANASSAPVEQQFAIHGLSAFAATPWITSETQSLEELGSQAFAEGVFSYEIPAYSIVTFAGNGVLKKSFQAFLDDRELSESQRGFADDFDQDGLSAGFEYLLGADPERPDYQSLEWQRNDISDTIRLPVSLGVGQGVLKIQSSADLVEWKTEAAYDFATGTAENLTYHADDAGAEIVYARAEQGDLSRVFYRAQFALAAE